MNLTQKISQMTPKGADLDATDLIEVSTIVGGSYVTKSITGQELIDAIPLPPTGLTVGTTPIASGTIGRVLFQGTGNVLQQSGNLFWDNTNNRLGIGTSSPSNSLTIKTGVNDDGILLESSVGNPLFLVRKDGTSNSTAELFQYSNGSIRLAIRSASNFSYFNGGNFGFGTTTDAGFRLDVNGNSRVRGAGATGSTNAFTVQNSSGSSALSITNGLTTIVHGDLQLENTVLYWSSGSQIRNISNGVLRISDSTNANFTRLQFGGGTTAFPSLQRSGSALAVMDATGTALTNLLVGTTTDAGFRLDVNGTARVSGAATLAGTNTLSGTTNVSGLSSNWICQYPSNATVKPLSFSAQSGGATSNNVAIQFGFNFRESGGVFTQDIFQNILYDNTTNNVVTGFEWYTHQTQAGSNPSVFAMALRGKTLSIGTNTPNASAVLQADSTTQGFLPPRMTTTQKNAIASPATGLQVYDTTLNQMSYYNGTTWTNI